MNLKKHCKSHKENTVHVERKKIKIRCSPSIQGGPPHVRQRHSLCPFSNVLLVFLETTSMNPHNSDDRAVTEGSFRPSRISARCSVSGERRGERQQSRAGRCWGGLCLCCFVGALQGNQRGGGGLGMHSCLRGPCLLFPWKGGSNCAANGDGLGVGAGAAFSFSAAAHPPWSMMLVHHC